MSRVIQFRCFYRGVMYPVKEMQFDTNGSFSVSIIEMDLDDLGIRDVSPDSEHIEGIMQFTGLHDKNGKEIFEGDFFQRPVKINNSLHGDWTIYQFMIKNGNTIISYLRSEKYTGIPEGYMAALYTDELDIDMKTLMFAKEVTLHEVEILGNIYQHEHLLK